ncbi:MAG: tetratricopeptide repeat protein [Pyrinomonadaceae bacterium]
MTPERWRQIEEIFHEALELDTAVRGEFLWASANGDDELRLEVEKLLDQFDDASSFIEQPLYDSAKSGVLSALLDESDEDPMVGKLLGNYRIEREIGRGGMGAVYEAYRADGEFRLRVALKVVKRGIDTDFVLKRFRNERQILAALDHPFITRLIDGGTTDDGRPYFVMEFIDGLPLYRYCDKNRLSVIERLQLFCRVTEAVEYAHQKLIIHRDLKPSNIFITHDGSPRLLDFGIAKLLDPDLASDTLQPTATALRMMTVDYASPEQVRGEKVTIATDIYSLGVILFELLTAHRPYKIKSRLPHDIARAICDEEPYLASVAAGSTDPDLPVVKVNPSAPTLTAVTDASSESPARLAELLRGNIDSIVTKAIRKEPGERYATIAEFREDIERHLNGEAVEVPSFYKSSNQRSGSPSGEKNTLVAVLPLSLMGPTGSETTDESYLMIGLADAIITRMTSVRQLTVRPTSSITRYNEHQINPFRAGMELGVDFVLDGRIRRFGERLRISLQLLDVTHGSAIWAGHFDEHLIDVLALEDAISRQVADALIPHLTGKDHEKLSKRSTNDPAAHEAYLRGRFYWNQFTSQSLPKALESYKIAVQFDPNYAQAHSAIAEFYIWAGIYGLIPTVEAYRNAWDYVHSALALDPDLAEAHAANGLLLNNEFRYGPAETSFQRSISLNPQYSLGREWYAALLIGNGRFDEGIEQMLLSEQLDPMSLRTKILVIWYYYQTRQYEKAIAKANEVLAIDPNYPQGYLQRGNVLSFMGRHDDALDDLARATEMMPSAALVEYHLCFAYQRAGRLEDTRNLADSIEARSKMEFVKPYFIGMANFAAGRIDKAFHFLETALNERDAWLVWIGTEPNLEPLHDDPRFKRIVAATHREIVDGRVRVIDKDLPFDTSLHISEAVTEPLSDSNTTEFALGFFRRHRIGIAVAGALILLIGIGYLTGILSVSIQRDPPAALRPMQGAPRSIAVLPFENETGDESNNYISDGLGDALTLQLASYPEIRSVTRTSIAPLKKNSLDAQAIGRELGAESVVTGKLTRRNDGFSLNLQHVNVGDGKVIFSMYFIETPDKMLSLQGEMTKLAIEKLQLKADAITAEQPKSYTANNEAFSLYLKGEYSRQKGTPAGTSESIDFYKQAIQLDPDYALAYQGLALAYRMAPAYGVQPPQEAYPAAKSAAMKALAIDPSLGSAHVPLASIKFVWDWDFAGAETEYKEAIRLVPNNAEAHYSYGNALVALGRADESLTELRIAQQLDPLSMTIASNTGWALYIAGRLDEAETQIRQVLARDPNYPRAHLVLGEIALERGKYDQAIAAFQKSKQLAGDPLTDMAIGHVFGVAGRSAEARKIAAELEAKVMKKEVSAFLPAVVYAGLDEKDKAFYWLERAYQERSNWLTLIKVGRRLKNLHGDPRFDDLLKRVGFPA